MNDFVFIGGRRETKDSLPSSVSYPATGPWNIIPIGEGEEGSQVSLNLISSPHTLLVGAIKSGQSSILNSILAHCVRSDAGWQVYGLDVMKQAGLNNYLELDVVKNVALDRTGGLAIVDELLNEMQRRHHLMLNNGVKSFRKNNLPPILLVIENLAHLEWPFTGNHPEALAEETLNVRLMMMIGEIARLGAPVGIHLLLGANNPSETMLPESLKKNLSCLITEQRLKSNIIELVFDDLNKRDKATNLRQMSDEGRSFQGRSYMEVNGNGIEFQAYSVPYKTLQELNKK